MQETCNTRIRIGLTLFLLFSCVLGKAQVVINEFSAANYTQWDVGDTFDWIELYNAGGIGVDLSGYHLSDNALNVNKWEFPAGTIIGPGEHLVVLCSGLGDFEPNAFGYLNTSFRLRQTGNEEVVLSDPGEAVLEMYEFNVIGANQANHSWGRSTDGNPDWAIFTNPTPGASNVGANYSEYVARPQFDQAPGHYAGAITVALSHPDPAAEIFYTLDGTTPDQASTPYSGPIAIAATTVVKAIAFHPAPEVLPSYLETNTYFIGGDAHVIPVVSVSGPETSDGSWPWGTGEFTVIEYFDENGVFRAESVGDANEHGNDSNAYDQRGFDFIARDQMGYDHALEHNPFENYRDRQSYQRLIFKAAANDNYSFEGGAHLRDLYLHLLSERGGMKMDERIGSYCIVYLNGMYWGVYDVREKVDDLDFTDHYYDQPRNYVDFLKTWGGTWEEYGTGDDWYDLVDFITANDMSDPANYAYVQASLNTKSLADYFILNTHAVCADWLNWNTAWWRGRHPDGDGRRWRYALWDLDASFGHYINYTGVPDTGPNADPCDIQDMGDIGGQGHVPVLNALMDNEEFYSDYLGRYAAYLNGVLSCDFMNQFLDSLSGVIDPEMDRQCDRWGGSYAGWQGQVQELRDFIDARCDQNLMPGLEDCYDVQPITITIIIDGIGTVEIENFEIDETMAPWTGTFFSNIILDFDAFSDESIFLGWELISGDLIIDDPTNPSVDWTLTGDVTLVAHFATELGPELVMYDVQPPGAGDVLLDGTSTAPHPNTLLTDGGVHEVSAVPNTWYVFDHWEVENSVFVPGVSDSTGTVTVFTADTVTAFFNEIPHFDLMVDVYPAGAGSVSLDGADLANLPWSGVLEAGLDYALSTTTADSWNTFSHWEVNNHALLPDALTPDVLLTLTSTDTIVAVYEVTPHTELVVQVEPPLTGTVDVAGLTTVNDEWSGELEGGIAQTFVASPIDFYRFVGWESLYHAPSPNAASATVGWNFLTEQDTIVARFEPEPFHVFLPNTFTPDDDGINDVWQPEYSAIDVSSYALYIFGRNGEKVFESTDPSEAWDGSFNGGTHFVQNDVYIFRLTVRPVFEAEPRIFNGHITVIR